MAAEDLRVALGLLDARVVCGDPKVAEPVIEGARERWAKQKPPWLGRAGRPGGRAPPVLRRRRLPARARPEGVPRRPAGHRRPRRHDAGGAGPGRLRGHGGHRQRPAGADRHPGGAPPAGRAGAEQAAPPGAGPGGRGPGRAGRRCPDARRGHGRPHRGLGGGRRLAATRCLARSKNRDAARRRSGGRRVRGRGAGRHRGAGRPRHRRDRRRGGPDRGGRRGRRPVTLPPAGRGGGGEEPAHRPGRPQPAGPQGTTAARALARRPPGHPGPGAGHRPPGHRRPRGPGPAHTCSSATCPNGLRSATSPNATPTTGSPWTVTCSRPPPTPPPWPTGWRGPTCCCSAPCSTTSARASPATTPRWAWAWSPTSARGWGCLPRTWTPWSPWSGCTYSSPTPPPAATSTTRPPPSGWPRRSATGPTLELLAALVEADSLATGPSAWGPWKAGLVAELVERTGRLLAGEPATPPTPWITDELRMIMDTVRDHRVPALSIEDPTVTVVAPDRPGLLAEVTGVLALHGLNVRSAVVAGEDGVAVEIFTVEPSRGRWPAAARLADDLAAVMDGTLSHRAPAGRAGPHLPQRAPGHHAPAGLDPGQRGQQRLGHRHGGGGPGRGRRGPAPPDHPGPGRLPTGRHLGQGLHLRIGGGRRLLRPGARRGQADRSPAASPRSEAAIRHRIDSASAGAATA